jgi:Tol biopolymer transport system component
MVFVRTNSGRPDLMVKPVAPGSDEQPLAQNARFPTVTADGRRVVFNQQVERSWQVAWLDVEKPSEIHTLGPAHLGARFPAVSPDGRLVAYVSGEIGRDEIFLTRFPSGEGKWQVSSDGGGWCRFSGRGDAVVYRAPNGDFMSVPISVGDDVKIGRPLRLFEWGAGWMAFYELARDGARGITAVPVGRTAGTTSLSLVQNWHLEFSGR